MKHVLKVVTPFWEHVADGTKPFELRKNDRQYALGDSIVLQEWDQDSLEFTKRELTAEITYILDGGTLRERSIAGLLPGYCILGLRITAVSEERSPA